MENLWIFKNKSQRNILHETSICYKICSHRLHLIRNYATIYLEKIRNRWWPIAFAAVFRALSDPNRREILSMLKKGRMSAGEIGAQFDMSAATVSYHLAKLKEAELIYETRDKNSIYYSLNVSVFEDIMLWSSQFLQGGIDDEKTD